MTCATVCRTALHLAYARVTICLAIGGVVIHDRGMTKTPIGRSDQEHNDPVTQILLARHVGNHVQSDHGDGRVIDIRGTGMTGRTVVVAFDRHCDGADFWTGNLTAFQRTFFTPR